jgi:hypothetical protein
MGYTLGQAARAVGMPKTSILRSIKADRISGTKEEFWRWCLEAMRAALGFIRLLQTYRTAPVRTNEP